METQAYICPHCFNDHDNNYCKTEDVREVISTLHKDVIDKLHTRINTLTQGLELLHDHLDPNIEYGNCIACIALRGNEK